MNELSSDISILQITDCHILPCLNETFLGINTEHYFLAVLELALAENGPFDLIIITGDLAQNPCQESYQRILKHLEATQTPCICLPGNHDDISLMLQIFNRPLVSCRKQMLLGNWQLIFLNSQIKGASGGQLSNQELCLLDECLSKHPDHYALIAVHHHCLETKSAWMDTMMIENSFELWSIIDKYPKVKIITNGHIHQLMDIEYRGVRVLGAPSTCFQFKPNNPTFSLDNIASPGYRQITLSSNGSLQTFISRLPEPLKDLQIDSLGY
jgi:Icc protein